MSLVEKAYNIDCEKKALAKAIYKRAFERLAQNFGGWDVADAHTQLSVEFGEFWVLYAERGNYDIEAVRRANNAFNYANLELGAGYKILETAKELLDKKKYNEANVFWLKRSADEFNMLLTNV
jgi:hypothetical protein